MERITFSLPPKTKPPFSQSPLGFLVKTPSNSDTPLRRGTVGFDSTGFIHFRVFYSTTNHLAKSAEISFRFVLFSWVSFDGRKREGRIEIEREREGDREKEREEEREGEEERERSVKR